MLAYFIFLGVVFLQALCMCQIEPICKKLPAAKGAGKRRNLFIWLVCAELILFTGLRGETIGADTATYLRALDTYQGVSFYEVFTKPLQWPFDFEIGYFVLTKLCAWLHFPPTVFLLLISAITYVPLFRYIREQSDDPLLSLLIYFAFGFFSYSLGIFRQMIAISILMMGYKYIYQRRLGMYLLTVGCAMLFHTTAILAVVLYFLTLFDMRQFVPTLVALELVLVVFGRLAIELMVALMPMYSGYISGRYDLQGGSYLNLILLNIIFFGYLFLLRDRNRLSGEERLILSQLVVGILCQCCGYHMAVFGRIVCYYSMCYVIVLPKLLDGYSRWLGKFLPAKLPVKQILWCGAVAFLLLLTFREFHGNDYVAPFYFWGMSPN